MTVLGVNSFRCHGLFIIVVLCISLLTPLLPGPSASAQGSDPRSLSSTTTSFNSLSKQAETADPIMLEFHFSQPEVTDASNWASVSIPGLPRYGAPGEPVLPFKTVIALIPQRESVQSVQVRGHNERVLEGRHNVEYGKTPLPVSSNTTVVDHPKQAIYSSTDPFPGVWFSDVSEQHLRGYTIVVLRLHPVQYVPQSGRLSFSETMTVTIGTVEGSISPFSRDLPEDRLSVLAAVDNPGEAESYTEKHGRLLQPTTLVDPSKSYDYVIITSSALRSAFQPLVDWKIQKGVNTTVVLLEDILKEPAYSCNGVFGDGYGAQFNDTQAHVRNFIKDAYMNWGTEYVLLGGDDELIPARGMYAYAGDLTDYAIPCDMYYGCLDGSWDKDNDTIFGEAVYDWVGPENGTAGEEADFFAEVYIGRATVDTSQEAQNFVSKTLQYEQNTGAAYLNGALMIGETLDASTEGGNGKDLVTDIIPQYTTRRLYNRDGTFSSSEVVNEMNKGTHIINHDGHANEGYVMGLVNSDVDGLSNTDYFMVYSLGCYSAAFDEATSGAQEAIAEHFVFNAHGAFAYIGNSRYGWYNPGSTNGPGEMYDRSFFDVLSSGTRNIGKTLQDSKELLFSTYFHRWTYYTLNLLGDPETEVVTDITAPTAHFRTRTDLLAPPHVRGGVVLLNGTAKRGPGAGATFDNYTIDFGLGLNPTSWFSAGISLTGNGETEIVDDALATWDTSLLSDGVYTLRITVFDVDGHVGQDWMVIQIGLNLIVEVYDSLGQPAAYAGIYGRGSTGQWLFEQTDENGRLEMYVEPSQWGEYTLCAWSSAYRFVLYKTGITIGSEEVRVIFNASEGTVAVTVHAQDTNGIDMEHAAVCFVLTGTTMNAILSGTDSNGLIEVLVYPATYQIEAMRGGDEAYYLFKTNVVVNGPTYVSFEPALSNVGTLHLNFEKVVANESWFGFACWPYSPISVDWAFVWSPSIVYLTPGSYSTWIQIGAGSPAWYYDLGNPDMTFASDSSSSFDFGGHLNLTVQTEDRYTKGDTVEIAWDLTDAYQHQVKYITSSSEGSANVGKTVVKNNVDGSYDVPAGTVYPRLQVIDPYGSVLLDQTVSWWGYRSYDYTLPTNSPTGTYTVRITLDTGPYEGTLLAEDHFDLAGAIFNKNELIEATIEGGSISTVDPAAAYDTASGALIFNVYDTLVRFAVNKSLPAAEQGRLDEFVPSLATEWSIVQNNPPIVDSDTGLSWSYTYYFKIRTGVEWQDPEFGTVSTADVEYSFERAMVMDYLGGPQWMFYEPLLNGATATYVNQRQVDPAGNLTERAWVGECIDHAVESNSTHVWFNLAFPGAYAPFLQILTETWSSIFSKAWANSLGRSSNWPGNWPDYTSWFTYHYPATPPFDNPTPAMMGSGPWKFDYLDQNAHVWSVVRFADYWGGWPASISGGYVERVTMSWADDWNTRKAKFLAGQVDFCAVPRQYIGEMLDQPNIRCTFPLPSLSVGVADWQFDIRTTSPYGPIYEYGIINEAGVPRDFFGNTTYGIYIRKAFSHCIDFPTYLNTVFLGEAIQPPTAMIPTLPYYNASIPKYSLDLTKAAELFHMWPGLWDTGFTIKLVYNIGNLARQTLCEMLAASVNSLNPKFHASALGLDWAPYLAASSGKQLPVFVAGWLADYPDAHDFAYPYYYSYGTYASRQGYSDPVMDALIDEGIRTPDGPARAAIYSAVQQRAIDMCPSVGLYSAIGRHFEQTWVQGWYYNPIYPANYFYELWKDRIPTVSVRPSEVTVVSGQEFTVDVDLDYAENLYVFQFKCDFNSSVLEATAVEYLGYLNEPTIPVTPIINNIEGYVVYGCSEAGMTQTTGGSPPPLARIHFKALHNGTSPLQLSDDGTTFLLDANLNSIPIQTSNGAVTVLPCVVSVSPSTMTVAVGQEFAVNVTLNYAERLYAYESWLGFDSSLLNATSINYAGYLGTLDDDHLIVTQVVNNTGGFVTMSVSRLWPYAGVTGGGVLATVHFKAVRNGTSTLHLFETYLSDDETKAIPHETMDGQVTVLLQANLAIDDLVVKDLGCTTYANDTYLNGTNYYVPVEVTVKNPGIGACGGFNVSLSVYSYNASSQESYFEWRVAGLSAGENVTLTYNWHPSHTGLYNFTAMADCHGEVAETDEGDNTLILSGFRVALLGDIDRSGRDDILDVGVVTRAWNARPGDLNWNIKADLNHDGKINVLDISRITLRWRQTW